MRRATPIILSVDQRAGLTRLSRSRRVSVRLVERAKIVLLAAEGHENLKIAQRLGISRQKAGRVAGSICPPWPGRHREGRPSRRTPTPTHRRPKKPKWVRKTLQENACPRHPLEPVDHGRSHGIQRIGPSAGSGSATGSSRTASRRSSSRMTRNLSRSSTTSSGCISRHPNTRSCFGVMRKARSRRWTAPSRACR